MKPKPVLVRWRDAHSVGDANWLDADQLRDKECIVTSCGLLVKKGKKHLTIVQCFNPASPAPHRAVFRIPLGNVVEMHVLKR